jgi:hypothetical protein
VKAEDIPAILSLLEQSKEWLEGDGFSSTRGAYSEKIDRINAKVLPIKQRHDNLNHTTEEIGNFYACLDSNFQFLNSLVIFWFILGNKVRSHYSRREAGITELDRAIQIMGNQRAREAEHKEQMVRVSDINEGVERQGKVSER